MKAIIDILKDHGLYTFMSVKEELLRRIQICLAETEYSGRYGLSGSFTSTDQTISIVVGILAEVQTRVFSSIGSNLIPGQGSESLRDYTYGVNITGINDEEVKSLSRYLYYYLIDVIPSINYDIGVRIYPDILIQQANAVSIGDKRMWSVNIFLTVGISEAYPLRQYERTRSGLEGLFTEGYEPPDYSSCIMLPGEGSAPPLEDMTTEYEETTTP